MLQAPRSFAACLLGPLWWLQQSAELCQGRMHGPKGQSLPASTWLSSVKDKQLCQLECCGCCLVG